MVPILLCILSGIVVGYIARDQKILKHIGPLLSVVITLLLFSLGVSVGSNEQVLNNFATIGIEALLLTIGGTLGSLFCAKWIYTRFFKKGDA